MSIYRQVQHRHFVSDSQADEFFQDSFSTADRIRIEKVEGGWVITFIYDMPE